MKHERDGLDDFLGDIVPFFYGQKLTYVDVGAYRGEVFRKVLQSALTVREALLIEPNPASRAALERELAGVFSGHRLVISDRAASSEKGRVLMRSAESMTKVVADAGATDSEMASDSECFVAESAPLDDLVSTLSSDHISLLKIDVEGYERRVLAGSRTLLAMQRVDVIYIEAGMDPAGTQQCYYREIDDELRAHGYRLFRIYEQKNEWIEDSPFLRRVNLAYLSPEFAARSPHRLSRELHSVRSTNDKLQVQLSETSKQLESAQAGRKQLRKALEQLQAEHQKLTKEQDELQLTSTKLQRQNDERELEYQALDRSHRQARADRREFKARLIRTVKDIQTQTNCLLREKLVNEDLSRANDALTQRATQLEESLRAQSARVVELENQVAAIEGDRNGLVERLSQAETVVADLRKQLNKSSKEQETRAHAESKMIRQAKEERRALSETIKQLADDATAQEQLLRQVFGLATVLFRREQLARVEAVKSGQEAERIQAHLSYRLGKALVTNVKSPTDWILLPRALQRSYAEFRQARAVGESPTKRDFLGVLLGKPGRSAALPLEPRWQSVRVQNSKHSDSTSGAFELWVKPLSVAPHSTASLEFAVAPTTPNLEPMTPAVSLDSPEKSGPEPRIWTAKLRAGEAVPLWRYGQGAGHLDLQVRKVGGVPTILQLEVRSPLKPPRDSSITETRKEADAERSAYGESSANSVDWDDYEEPGPVMHAQKLINAGEFEKGLQLLVARGTPQEQRAAHILRANRITNDDGAWLEQLNRYVEQFDIAPLSLADGSDSRFVRLRAVPTRILESGPLVSVIMPVYNGSETLRIAAQSILDQTWRPIELIIVDDCSTDTTWAIAQQLAAQDKRVKVLRNAGNAGPYVARNSGLQAARGTYITCHDSDDWAHPHRIERHVQVMLREHMKASLTRMLRMSPDGVFANAVARQRNVDDGFLRPSLVSCMFEAEFFRQRLGYWDSVRFAGDSELIWRTRHLLGEQLPILRQLGMICLDSEHNLTRDRKHGAGSVIRVKYSSSFKLWHNTIDPREKGSAYLPSYQEVRCFDAPAEMLASDDIVAATVLGRKVDVCIITNLRFPGGNASSTLDEVRQCQLAGLAVQVLHCGRPLKNGERDTRPWSERYSDILHLCEDPLSSGRSYECDVLIVRNPTVITSPDLPKAISGVSAKTVVLVINNSMLRPTGEAICSEEQLLRAIESLPFRNKKVHPLGPAIRHELLKSSLAERLTIAPTDWSPTFSVEEFEQREPTPIGTPIRIGRHGRDGREKWLKSREELLAVYPDSPEVTVRILGGADNARKAVDTIPERWEVLPFGAQHPAEFLRTLDVFVYFPDENLNEAFGRTVVEAMLVGLPCVLPTRMELTFGDLAIYCAPLEVPAALRRLQASGDSCAAFVAAVRPRAAARYASGAILQRLSSLSTSIAARLVDAGPVPEDARGEMPEHLRRYAHWVATGHEEPTPALTASASVNTQATDLPIPGSQ